VSAILFGQHLIISRPEWLLLEFGTWSFGARSLWLLLSGAAIGAARCCGISHRQSLCQSLSHSHSGPELCRCTRSWPNCQAMLGTGMFVGFLLFVLIESRTKWKMVNGLSTYQLSKLPTREENTGINLRLIIQKNSKLIRLASSFI